MGFSLKKITKSIGNVFKKVEQTIRPVVKAAIVPAATLVAGPIGAAAALAVQSGYESQDAVSDANKAYDAVVAGSNAPASGILPTDTVIKVPSSSLTPAGQGKTQGGLYEPSAVNQAPGTTTAPLFAGIDVKTMIIFAAIFLIFMMMRRR